MPELTDFMLLLHALASFMLSAMILRAAHIKHRDRLWRFWPPILLLAWFVSTAVDGSIFIRRWLERSTEWEHVKYDSIYSLALNTIGVIASVMLIYRIFIGDTDEFAARERQREFEDREQ